jgi:2-(1,2-epoxy-1,2-dihydrophenyl)acetyl-CoA isomerase
MTDEVLVQCVEGIGTVTMNRPEKPNALTTAEFTEPTLEGRAQTLRYAMDCARILRDMPKSTIAMVRGAAAGAGLSIALSCDLRIASANGRFMTAFEGR